ncbi:uncharacterized protein BYT42DRAFT_215287 [Radiomyces spectabilis]|uniref:uncharacterized protein n=1 Tax=Radiomyces spectabilis TaxID=64574 RepID=UPI00221FCC42|nr:uncharacterized protein BYT42DRAFT_215287 [Radiomyces spectabilis]KAI8387945.1 hypothetical protein BYT42DRAFT_215287 [Radiomyces spectabilis]
MHMLQWTEQTTLLPFPPVHTESFWAKCFLFVSSLCLGARDLRSFRHPWEHNLWDTFQNFFIPSSEGYRYLRWIQLYNNWADPYSTKALTNATRHLSSNIFKFMLHVCEAFFRTYSEHHGVTLSQTAKTLRKKVVKAIQKHDLFNQEEWNTLSGDWLQIQTLYRCADHNIWNVK